MLIFLLGSVLNCFAEPVPLEITPVAPVRLETRGNVCFADFGQAAFGNLQITFREPVPAGKLTVRLGEKLNATGAIDRQPPGSVNVREIELVTSADQRVYQLTIPSKKFHLGAASVKTPPAIGEVTPFRYAEIENAPEALTAASLRQLAVHAPFADDASAFECSDPTLNAVWALCKHTMKATTAFGIYIDGERERIPYEADAYLNLLSHYACDLDPRMARATFTHLLAHPTWPTEWSLHMPMMADADYEATGDPVMAADHYDALKKKLLANKAGPDGLLRASAIVDWPAAERDGYNDGVVDQREKKQVGPEVNTVANAFYYHALRCMARLALALQKPDDARAFTAQADRVYQTFNTAFFDPVRGVYTDGVGSAHASLHANMFPLAFGLVPPERRPTVADFVQSRGMACSVYGAQYLLEGLYQAGRPDAALRLMTSHDERSWWHMIELGSTMTLEAWGAKAKPNLTWNHAWGAAPANILTRFVLGVRPLEPGYTRLLIAPQPGMLTSLSGKVPTPLGAVLVTFSTDAHSQSLVIEVPPGAKARVILPGPAATSSERVLVNDKPVTLQPSQGALALDDIPAGHYVIERLAPVRN
ncbi:MAG: family 78 glycoside hydrolase catalytic domain [Verrucomicrobia bacterium]|nr:family 78 glycoside hydrolase catalytic domain [Verrucomicrobiota bacterium]